VAAVPVQVKVEMQAVEDRLEVVSIDINVK
jgi:hypothetical protein